MPLIGYFSKPGTRELKMPRVDEGVADANGLVLHGDILTGRFSVPEAIAREGATLSQTLPLGTRVDSVEDFDPVLKFHLGLK
jgi:hypothetical protein